MRMKLSKRGALAIMQARYGDRAFVRDNGRHLTPERHAAARAALAAHRERKPATIPPHVFVNLPEDERRARNMAYREWRAEDNRLLGEALRQRFEVGHEHRGGIFFRTIDGQGDTWDEAIASAKRKWL